VTSHGLMEGAPPPADRQVTLANWRGAPFNRWGFRNARNLVPSAAIRPDPLRRWHLEAAPRALGELAFRGPDGADWTLDGWLAHSVTDALLVLHGGRLVLERYLDGMTGCEQHILMSVSKSLTGALAGALVGRGELDPEAPVARYVPEVAGGAYAGASVRQLLDMRVGVRFDEDYAEPDGAMVRYREAMGWKPPSDPARPGDLRGFVAALPAEGAHGGPFRYVSPTCDLLGWVLERAAGPSFAALMSELIWRPLGAAAEAYVTVDRLGAARVAGGICATARDLGRFGLMMLRGGRAGEGAEARRVVPAAWVEDIRHGGDKAAWRDGDFADTFPSGAYRSQWYATGCDDGAFCAIGIHGQYLWISPASETVIVKYSSMPEAVDYAQDALAFAAFRALCAARG